MTISGLTSGSYNSSLATQMLVDQKNKLNDLQQQLSSGTISNTYGGLGAKASTVLSLNSKASAVQGYLNTIASASTRVSLVNSTLTQLAKNVSASNANNLYSFSFSDNAAANSAQIANNYLSQAVDALNTGVNGQYYFSGRSDTTKPVVDLDTILNGDATHAGVKELISERKAADYGTGTGRLVISGVGTGVSLSEEAAGLPFGIKLNTAVQNGLSNAATTGPSSGTIGVTFSGLPTAGESATFTLSLPDGTTTDVKLTATTNNPPAAGEFTIGTDAATTAANFQTALTTSITTVANTTLQSASALKAASDFYAGSSSNPPARIAGPPYASATAYLTPAQAAASTVIWYQGDDDTSVSALDTSAQRIDSSQVVGIGARANEQGIQTALAQWTVLATESFSASNTNDAARYEALATRIQTNFSDPTKQSVQDIAGQISISNAAISTAKTNNTQKLSYLTGASTDITAADPTTILTEINTLQTQLQASYQVTGTLGQLSLVNFLK